MKWSHGVKRTIDGLLVRVGQALESIIAATIVQPKFSPVLQSKVVAVTAGQQQSCGCTGSSVLQIASSLQANVRLSMQLADADLHRHAQRLGLNKLLAGIGRC